MNDDNEHKPPRCIDDQIETIEFWTTIAVIVCVAVIGLALSLS